MSTKNIVFIHGMYMTPLCWEHWVTRYGAQGYNCMAVAWPGRDKPVEILRQNHPDPELGKLTLTHVVDHLAGVVRGLGEKPILIGHSMGGLVVQLLLQRGLGALGVAISSAPPMGVFTAQWPFLRANWPHITPFAAQGVPVRMSFERFQYTFVNGMPEADQRAAYERYAVPESRRVPSESLSAKVDFRKEHVPLLLVAGSNDHLIPAALVRTNHKRYASSGSITGFKEFPGRAHFIVGQKGWEEVADWVLSWVRANGF